MDRQRHRLLTENVSFIQKRLTVTRDLLKTCVYQGVFREEEEQTIWVKPLFFLPFCSGRFKCFGLRSK